MKSHQIVEWAPFRLAPGVSEEELRAAARELHDQFLTKQPGFLRRALLRGSEGQWVDLLYWESETAMADAMGKVANSAACTAYFNLMASSADGGGVFQFAVVDEFAACDAG